MGRASIHDDTKDVFLAIAGMGGMLGLIMANIFDCGVKKMFAKKEAESRKAAGSTSQSNPASTAINDAPSDSDPDGTQTTPGGTFTDLSSQPRPMMYHSTDFSIEVKCRTIPNPWGKRFAKGRKKLKLDVLELEKLHLSVLVLNKTIDFTVLTSLTLLNCEGDEKLWISLRERYTPMTVGGVYLTTQHQGVKPAKRNDGK